MIHVPDPTRITLDPPGPSPLDTAEFSHEEILQRLELGRLVVKNTEEGSRLEVAHVATPSTDRRTLGDANPHPDMDRRRYRPLSIPTLFPESGAILVLLVGGFADDSALKCLAPFWEDGNPGSTFIWQAMSRAGLIHRRDTGFNQENSGSRGNHPPRIQGLAMTYAGFKRRGEIPDFDRIIHPWNLHRLHTLIQASWERSMDRLKIITVGEAARFMMCSCVYGMPDIPVLSLPEPTTECLARNSSDASNWVEWAADLMVVGRSLEI